MNEQQIINELAAYINKIESQKGEIELFSWGHMLRGKIERDYNITDLNKQRYLYIQAYNITHPNTPYEYKEV
jgi:hypothetical protein